MHTEKSNPSIKCSVNSCAYHNGQAQTCTLDAIKVGCCDSTVASRTETECSSFKLGDHGANCSTC